VLVSSAGVLAVRNAYHQHGNFSVINIADNALVPDAITPQSGTKRVMVAARWPSNSWSRTI